MNRKLKETLIMKYHSQFDSKNNNIQPNITKIIETRANNITKFIRKTKTQKNNITPQISNLTLKNNTSNTDNTTNTTNTD